VISDRLADRLWPGADPLGRRIEVFTANGSLAGLRTVVGTVHPIRFDVDADLGLDVFLPAGQVAWTSGVVFMRGPRTERERHEMLTREAAALDSRVVVHDAASLEARLARSLAAERLIAGALLTFAAVAVLLAVLGIYTMTSQAVAGAERELAVRKALGASMRDIQLLVGRRAVVVAVTGAIAGTTAALWGGGVLTALLHGMPPTDPIILLAPLVTSVAVAAAVAWPIHRANHVNPVLAMRE
jgi:predicted lysophospholipase L1 biosynthesis ABC-type transport system permease subunit